MGFKLEIGLLYKTIHKIKEFYKLFLIISLLYINTSKIKN